MFERKEAKRIDMRKDGQDFMDKFRSLRKKAIGLTMSDVNKFYMDDEELSMARDIVNLTADLEDIMDEYFSVVQYQTEMLTDLQAEVKKTNDRLNSSTEKILAELKKNSK